VFFLCPGSTPVFLTGFASFTGTNKTMVTPLDPDVMNEVQCSA
jgi:hypothetical protein